MLWEAGLWGNVCAVQAEETDLLGTGAGTPGTAPLPSRSICLSDVALPVSLPTWTVRVTAIAVSIPGSNK